ncbi:thioredoxin-like protein, partial [Dichomitus squalens]
QARASEESHNGVTHEEFIERGVRYEPSPITAYHYQSVASKLIVGEHRVIPHNFIRVADARPYNIRDLAPSDARFKVLVFAGNTPDKAQAARGQALADEMAQLDSFLARFGKGDSAKMYVWSISAAKKQDVNYIDLPPLFRPHCSHVLLDDTDMYARGGYDAYSVDKQEGVIVIVRPNDHVDMVARFERIKDVDAYFACSMTLTWTREGLTCNCG